MPPKSSYAFLNPISYCVNFVLNTQQKPMLIDILLLIDVYNQYS